LMTTSALKRRESVMDSKIKPDTHRWKNVVTRILLAFCARSEGVRVSSVNVIALTRMKSGRRADRANAGGELLMTTSALKRQESVIGSK